ncbi:MAG TPA: hypothetical protein VJ372_15350 [Pyrinomonadaceae bacterium]|jgi:hypothetical protein|nr:hypothetical protein [Pyrinomonadaceae bacterium]
MRTTHPLHNPFINRFNDPVSRRHDEMQSHEYMMWLRDRDQVTLQTQHSKMSIAKESAHAVRLLAGIFGLAVLIVSFALLLK